MKKQVYSSLLVFLIFLISFYGKSIFSSLVPLELSSVWSRTVYSYFWWILPPILYALLITQKNNMIAVFGLNKPLSKAFLFAFFCVLPMFLGSWLAGSFVQNPDVGLIVRQTLLPGFFEEWLFRGFLFGFLFRYVVMGFIPSALVGSFFFGIAHVYQGTSIGETIGIFMITGMGAAWFAWLYTEWDYNLWVPIFFHFLMNLSWTLFEVSENALGGLAANGFRAMTIALSVIFTIRMAKKRGFYVNKTNLLWKQTGQ